MSHDPARRGFLRNSIAIIPATAIAGASPVPAQERAATSPVPAFPPTPATQSGPYTPVFFNAAEMSFVTAAVARLIPADETGPSAVEAGVPEFIDRQMQGAFGLAATWYMQ